MTASQPSGGSVRGYPPVLGRHRPAMRLRPGPGQRWRPILHRWTRLLTFVALWLALLLLAGGGGPPMLSFLTPRVALAAPELMTRPGYFGQVPPNGWIPVEVVVRNQDTTPFRGEVEVRQLPGSGAGGPPGRVGPVPPPGTPGSGAVPGLGEAVSARWRIPIEVPPGEARGAIPWIWWNPGARYEVHLLDESSRSVASMPLQGSMLSENNTLVAVLAERSIPYLRTLPGVRQGSVVALEAYPQLLPRSSSGWFGFDVVIIDGAAALQQLQQDQLEALRRWVKLGGTLVLGTGADAAAMARALGPELFPWTVRDTVETSDYGEAVVLARRLGTDAPGLGGGAPPSVAAILVERQAGRETGETTDTAKGAGSGGRNTASPVPLTYRADVGLGRVYAWATRLDAEPWLSWRGMPEAIASWLGPDLAPAQVRRADSFHGGFGIGHGGPGVPGGGPARPIPHAVAIEAGGPRALALTFGRALSPMGSTSMLTHHLLYQAARDLPGLQLPAPGVMLAGVGAYLVLIGPVTFGWLRRRRRREWAWIAVPALALASILVAYLAGTATGAVASRNATGYLLVTPDGDSGLWAGTAGMYRPAGTAELQLRREALVAPLSDPFTFGQSFGQDAGSGLTVEPVLAGQRVSWLDPAPGRIPAARVQADIVLGGKLEARWQPAGPKGDEWKVEVVNGLDLTLRNPVIVQGGQILSRLPDLAPGQRHEDRVRPQPPQPAQGPWPPWSPLFSQPGPGPRAADWRARQEARLQQALAETSQGVASGALLVALVEGSPVFSPGDGGAAGPTANGGSTSQATRWNPNGVTLLVQPLALAIPGAGGDTPAFRLTNTIVPLETREALADAVESPGPGMPVQIAGGMLEMEWRPPAALARRASALVIDVPAGIGIELYDHAEARWLTVRAPGENDLPAGAPAWARRDVQVAGDRVRITGAALGRFFGPDGRLPLKLTVEGRATLPTPVLTLEGGGEVRER